MKSIILFRHARSEIGDFNRDHYRLLVSKGIEDAKKMGLYLSGKKQLPEIVISSTALRSKITADTAMEEGKWPCPLILEAGIYGGSPIFLLNLVNFYLQENRNQKVQILLHLHIYLVTLEFLHKTHRSTTLVHAYVISDDLA